MDLRGHVELVDLAITGRVKHIKMLSYFYSFFSVMTSGVSVGYLVYTYFESHIKLSMNRKQSDLDNTSEDIIYTN